MLNFNENRFFEQPKSRRLERQKNLLQNFKNNFQKNKKPLKKFSEFTNEDIENNRYNFMNFYKVYPIINDVKLVHRAIDFLNKKFEGLDNMMNSKEVEAYIALQNIYDQKSKNLDELNKLKDRMWELLDILNNRLLT